jgi:hypothetical protein
LLTDVTGVMVEPLLAFVAMTFAGFIETVTLDPIGVP